MVKHKQETNLVFVYKIISNRNILQVFSIEVEFIKGRKYKPSEFVCMITLCSIAQEFDIEQKFKII